MDPGLRKTVNFQSDDPSVVWPFLDAGTPEHDALEALAGEALRSDSAQLRALVMLGVRVAREALLRDDYDASVRAGDFDDSHRWSQATTARRRARTEP